MSDSSTIIAPASGPARSERAIIRLSGPGVPGLLTAMLDPAPTSRGAFASRLRIADSLRLPALLLNFPAPHSYTGEHAAELLVPGNPLLVARIVAAIVAHSDVREAAPGEFSARAYLNGRLSIDQAEGVAATIAARTEANLNAAKDLLSGLTGRRYASWSDEVATLLALVEAGIDFTDQEDVVPILPVDLRARLRDLLAQIETTLGARAGAEQAGSLPTVVLAGRPNAGKSTLFNALLGRHRAVVSPAAGTTRDVLAEPLDLSSDVAGGPTVTLIDLAGHDAVTAGSGPIDAAAQQAACRAVAAADVVVHCDPTGRFADALPSRAGRRRTVIRARTKADLPVLPPPDDASTPVCALDGWNLGPLRRAIADAAWRTGSPSATSSELLPRHRRTLAQASARLQEALDIVEPDATRGRLGSPELIAGALRESLDALGELAGRISPDDIVGRIFATFCVGK